MLTEVKTPLDNTIATSTGVFKTVTAVTGGDTWVTVDAADGIVAAAPPRRVRVPGSGAWSPSS